MKNYFPLWQYLNQSFFNSNTVFNPWKFWHNYQINLLERCWKNDFIKQLENCWFFEFNYDLTPLKDNCCKLDKDSE
jgi:hypothetical protein